MISKPRLGFVDRLTGLPKPVRILLWVLLGGAATTLGFSTSTAG